MNHALIFPSIWEESLPYTIIEPMLTGTIPIASNVRGILEIVKGTYAEKMMFELGNVDELVFASSSIAREIAEFLGKCRSQPKANVPTWSQVVELYINKLYC